MSTKLLCRWLSSFCWTLKYRWENSGATQKQQMRRIFRPSLSPTKALANSRFVRLKLRASSVRPSFVGLCSTILSQKSKMYVSRLLFSTLVLNDDDIRFYVICIYIVIVKGIQQLLVPLLPLENDLPPSWKRKK